MMETVSSVSLASDFQRLNDFNAALGSKDRYTQGHANRVALYSLRLARRLGLSFEDAENIGIGGYLHDIGKLGLSDRIFSNRTTHLYGDMLNEVRRHPDMGVALLKGINGFAPVLDFVHLHHERLDGSGYPYGLTADEIPLGAKIIAVADCFDAITTDRPYQKGKTCEQAFDILRRMGGQELSQYIVDAFITEIEENGSLDA
jgi:HD-GYP domain-containing protein (c-di-GMP phosphodiesterase class II)